MLFFCVQHSGINEVNIAEHIDPKYAVLMREAVASGVEVVAWRCTMDSKKVELNQQLLVNV